ncbi:hypothetical protein [Streptomyces sp. NPDC091278]|uniref:hypothetical protein n=1 Tax=Streptomyces sp. NPDC091278 TaxID=3155301 RepID=UPI0034502D3B
MTGRITDILRPGDQASTDDPAQRRGYTRAPRLTTPGSGVRGLLTVSRACLSCVARPHEDQLARLAAHSPGAALHLVRAETDIWTPLAPSGVRLRACPP